LSSRATVRVYSVLIGEIAEETMNTELIGQVAEQLYRTHWLDGGEDCTGLMVEVYGESCAVLRHNYPCNITLYSLETVLFKKAIL
jgi:hypothetical protein